MITHDGRDYTKEEIAEIRKSLLAALKPRCPIDNTTRLRIKETRAGNMGSPIMLWTVTCDGCGCINTVSPVG